MRTVELSHSRRGLRFWISAWLPVAIAIGIVMLESTVWFGADRTSQPLRRIWEAIFGHVSNRSWHLIHNCIRKSGHFLGFGLVGSAWLRAWRMSILRSRFVTDAVLALVGTAPVASGDELHQTFLPNRTGSVRDVMIDWPAPLCCKCLCICICVPLSPESWRMSYEASLLLRSDLTR